VFSDTYRAPAEQEVVTDMPYTCEGAAIPVEEVGLSLKGIAKQLNAEGVPPPRGTKKKTKPSWVYTAVGEMLRRDLYRGRIVWNRRKFKKRPGTNKRISVLRPNQNG